ncbi:MAG TPA: hypothetical protein PLB63_03800 [Planctomycetota bacterium]|nr:hypothetical protein [Planctomycetota bacterium]HQB00170.1 hypothetical protein [Planctomycetota bacterium]
MSEKISFSEICKFVYYILQGLRDGVFREQDWSKMPYIGNVELENWKFLFTAIWSLLGYADSQDLFIKIVGQQFPNGKIVYVLKVRDKSLVGFEECVQEVPRYDLDFNFEKLETLWQRKFIFFLFTLLRGDGNDQNLAKNFLTKIRISPNTFDIVLRWFFPLSGLCLLLEQDGEVLPILIYGGNHPQIQILKKSLLQSSLQEHTQYLRQLHKVSMAIGISLDALTDRALSTETKILSYRKKWVVSIPLEINDFLQAFPEYWQYFPKNDQYKQYNLDKEHILQLIRTYILNFQNYTKSQPLYLHLKDLHDDVYFEFTYNTLLEIEPPTPPEHTYKFNMETITTMMAWLNDTSLRLIAHFIKGILPAEVTEHIQRDEIVAVLHLKTETGESAILHIAASEQQLPIKSWQGDTYIALYKNSQLVFQEILLDTPPLITWEENEMLLDLPIHDMFPQETLHFQLQKSTSYNQGFTKHISSTSILTELAPGTRHVFTHAKYILPRQFNIQNTIYTIEQGSLLFHQTKGRILKHKAFISQTTYLYHSKKSSFLHQTASAHPQSYSWWKSFTEKYHQMNIQVTPLHIIDVDEATFPTTKLYIQNGYVIPYNYHGNYMVRIHATDKKHNILTLLEFPFFSKEIKSYIPFSVQIKKYKKIFLVLQNNSIVHVFPSIKNLYPQKFSSFFSNFHQFIKIWKRKHKKLKIIESFLKKENLES